MSQEQVVVHSTQVETMLSDWVTAKILSSPEVTGARNMSAVSIFFDPGQGHARHVHPDSDQIIFVISGQGEHMTEDAQGTQQKHPIAAGSLIHIPKGSYHATFNTGWEPLRILALYSPPGPETHMRESEEFRVIPAGQIPAR